MNKRLIAGIVLAMLVLGVAMLSFNVQKVRANGLIGDVDGDGDVDIADINAAIMAFGSNPLHSRWNAGADVDGSLKVDILDLATIISHYGETI